jgi:hypothetical protein
MKKPLNLKDLLKTKNFEDLTEKEIESRQKKNWKCPKCHEMVYINELSCWKCGGIRPEKYEHPGTEDIRREMLMDKHSVPFWGGIGMIVLGGLWVGHCYLRHSYREKRFGIIDLIFIAVLVLPGITMIIYSVFQKVKNKRKISEIDITH